LLDASKQRLMAASIASLKAEFKKEGNGKIETAMKKLGTMLDKNLDVPIAIANFES
jgi:hypothetical protein